MVMMREFSLDEVVNKLQQALALLESADGAYERSLEDETHDVNFRDKDLLEELLHVATHETASVLGLNLQEIMTLRQRVGVRRKYRLFTNIEFERIIREGWSTALVKELHDKLSDRTGLNLKELSELIKSVNREWQSIPPLIRSEK